MQGRKENGENLQTFTVSIGLPVAGSCFGLEIGLPGVAGINPFEVAVKSHQKIQEWFKYYTLSETWTASMLKWF